MVRFLIHWIILSAVMRSCESDPHGSHLFNEDTSTIGEYVKTNPKEYSKFNRILVEGKMLLPLCAYNPYGEGYTLFLPTNEAIDHFIEQNPDYGNIEELLQDTSFLITLTRYHTLNRKVRTDEFPYGALTDRTLTGDRLTIGFYIEDDNPLIKVNNVAPIIHSNLEMTNGYIHVISEVLHEVEISGYDWLQQQEDYSILAQAMELSGIMDRLWFDEYTILAEHDSIYHRSGIMNIEDLINRVATPGIPYSDISNAFNQFTTYHILFGEFYLNDLYLGLREYWTLGNAPVMIDVGLEIRINPGVDTFGITISEYGDTTIIDYIQPVWDACNILTNTGPVHSISDLLVAEPLPE
ncbi:MAG: fasciclin domain-containing protein [Bacteroidetes bacterium]|nr:fasciclin domain-containing protein [Bacteroidota bacterium]